MNQEEFYRLIDFLIAERDLLRVENPLFDPDGGFVGYVDSLSLEMLSLVAEKYFGKMVWEYVRNAVDEIGLESTETTAAKHRIWNMAMHVKHIGNKTTL